MSYLEYLVTLNAGCKLQVESILRAMTSRQDVSRQHCRIPRWCYLRFARMFGKSDETNARTYLDFVVRAKPFLQVSAQRRLAQDPLELLWRTAPDKPFCQVAASAEVYSFAGRRASARVWWV
jgi:hypothetical protein